MRRAARRSTGRRKAPSALLPVGHPLHPPSATHAASVALVAGHRRTVLSCPGAGDARRIPAARSGIRGRAGNPSRVEMTAVALSRARSPHGCARKDTPSWTARMPSAARFMGHAAANGFNQAKDLAEHLLPVMHALRQPGRRPQATAAACVTPTSAKRFAPPGSPPACREDCQIVDDVARRERRSRARAPDERARSRCVRLRRRKSRRDR